MSRTNIPPFSGEENYFGPQHPATTNYRTPLIVQSCSIITQAFAAGDWLQCYQEHLKSSETLKALRQFADHGPI
jgi:hypothetical protein